MKVIISETYNEMSALAADMAMEKLSGTDKPMVCVASGDTPTGLYKNFVRMNDSGLGNISNWDIVGLDEWVGMNLNDAGSCGYYLHHTLIRPLKAKSERYILFDGKSEDLDDECRKMRDFISKKGTLDLAILGLGVNGHLGLNEPGVSDHHLTHVSELSESTKSVGQKYFDSGKALSHGITLGLATLMNAKTIFLLVNGAHKAGILKQVVEGPVTKMVPGSLLQNHEDCYVFVDKSAAGALRR